MKLLRDWLYAVLAVALSVALYLVWLWQPQRQVDRHSRNLLHAIASRDWKRTTEFVAPDYNDQWKNDREQLIARSRELLASLGPVQFRPVGDAVMTREAGALHWRSRIIIAGQRNEILFVIQERLNSLQTPFDLEWRHASIRPWDWQLVGVSNPGLVLPDYAQ